MHRLHQIWGGGSQQQQRQQQKRQQISALPQKIDAGYFAEFCLLCGGNVAFCTKNWGNSLHELINDADPHPATYIHCLTGIMSWGPGGLGKEATL